MLFRDRREAGQRLAQHLTRYAHRSDVLVLALPRGGVPVAYEVARALHAPLDVFLVRKLGVPGQPELAMGAIAPGGVRVLNEMLIKAVDITPDEVETVAAEEQQELERRLRAYRDDLPPVDVRGRTIILIDDGLATGSTMRAAVEALRLQQPARIVVAVPVAAVSTCADFQTIADEMVCVETPEPFHAVGLWYEDFSQTTDAEVYDLLRRANHGFEPAAAGHF